MALDEGWAVFSCHMEKQNLSYLFVAISLWVAFAWPILFRCSQALCIMRCSRLCMYNDQIPKVTNQKMPKCGLNTFSVASHSFKHNLYFAQNFDIPDFYLIALVLKLF